MGLLLKNIRIPVEEGALPEILKKYAAETIDAQFNDIIGVNVRKKSLDARKKNKITYVMQLEVDVDQPQKFLRSANPNISLASTPKTSNPLEGLSFSHKRFNHRPVVVGSGPAGIFAALVLAEAGQAPIVVERGEPVEKRLKTVGRLRRKSLFNEESNYCFGEGGAGTFSDGKLTCGRNHPLIRYLFERWVEFGAPANILFDAHPHIGTDYLLVIAKRMRDYLSSLGTQFLFSTKFESFQTGDISRYKVLLSGGLALHTDHLIVAVGHSARDTYKMLYEKGIQIEPKPFAVGARIEHPQEDIDRIQYGTTCHLPSAEYKLAAKSSGRGIWTFCMCPGGHLLPTNAQPEHLAINGMSYNARNSGFANAAVVVNVNREDFFRGHPLDGVRFQERIEKDAFKGGGGQYYSPAQRLTDFLKGRSSRGELLSTYKPGVHSARLDKLLPSFIVSSLQGALLEYNKRMHGYVSDNAIVAGVESKTSAPIVMSRSKGLHSSSHEGVFPCGEGAGFAGGIVSASLDGVKVGRAVLEDALAESLYSHLH